MRNKFIYLFTCMLILSTTACKEEFLDIVPVDNPTVDGFYGNEAEIRAVTGSLYGRVWFEYNDKFSWAAGDGLSGDLYNDYQHEGQLYLFSFTENNNVASSGWRSLYNVVAYANSIINDMPAIASSKGVPEKTINAGLAEAKFVRAFAYYQLVEYWGAVPIVENAAKLISANNIDLPKHTIGSIYEFAIRDLEFAAANLPASDEPGRVNKWAAKGLLAKVLVTRGQRTGSADDFTKAMAEAKAVIETSGHSLMVDYADLFKIENNNNSESLFALQWIGGSWGLGNSRQAVFGRNSRLTGNGEAWGGAKGASYDFRRNLQENSEGKTDLRRPSIYMTEGDHYPEIWKAEGGYTYHLVYDDPVTGERLDNFANQGNNIKKYIVGTRDDVGQPINNQGVPLNQYMLRLADVYLVYAEAALGTAASTSDASALAYVNAIRKRAGLDPRSSLTFRQIFNERRVEFGMEGINWMDVKRFYYRDPTAALAYLNDQLRESRYYRLADEDGNEIGDPASIDSYMVINSTNDNLLRGDQTLLPAVTVSASEMSLPIPQGEVTQNPKLGPGVDPEEYIFE